MVCTDVEATAALHHAMIADPRLMVVEDSGVRKVLLIEKDEIGVAEAKTILTRNYDIADLVLKEPEIEEIVREQYKNQTS